MGGSVCKVNTQDPENFDEELKSLVTAWLTLPFFLLMPGSIRTALPRIKNLPVKLAQDLPFLDSKRQGTFTQHCFPLSFSGNERECWEFLDWRLASENDSLVPGQPSFLKELLF